MRRHSKVWIVLADGVSVRILLHRTWEPGKFEELAREVWNEAHQPARELVSDRLGCGFESAASLGHAAKWTVDPHAAAKARFERRLADLISQAAVQGLFDALVLVAPSHTLGPLRRALSPAAGERLVREVAKDFLSLPDQALSARLCALLRR